MKDVLRIIAVADTFTFAASDFGDDVERAFDSARTLPGATYTSVFEKRIVRTFRSFYRAKGHEWITTETTCTYLQKVCM